LQGSEQIHFGAIVSSAVHPHTSHKEISMSRKLFFSDCHISAGLGVTAGGDNEHAWEWLTPRDHQRLQAFIKWVTTRAAEIEEVILVGDIFDNWIFPHDIEPPTLPALLQSAYATPLVKALDSLSNAISTTLLLGNHDQSLTAGVLGQALPKVAFAGNNPLTWGKVRAEHGHAYGLFNAPDPLRRDNLPLGYFISRMVATADRKDGTHTPSISQVVKELGQLVARREDLAQGVFDAVCTKAGVAPSTEIVMPADLWGGETTTVQYVRDTYKDLYDEWKSRNGAASAIIAISAELNDLSLVANTIQIPDGPRAMVMGHTHVAASQRHSFPVLGHWVYVNSGTWCHNTQHASWVEAEDSSGALNMTVYGCAGFDADGQPQGLAPLVAPVST
jgi:UDP-2,3-diacylglucosamine pyrophosphatase LpxH